MLINILALLTALSLGATLFQIRWFIPARMRLDRQARVLRTVEPTLIRSVRLRELAIYPSIAVTVFLASWSFALR